MLRRISILISAMLTAFFCFGSGLTAFADEQGYSLTAEFVTDEAGAIEGSQFELYYALEPDGKLFGDFADLPVEVGDLSSSENVNTLASTLASYVETGFTENIDEVGSNALGEAKFTDLDAGIYLVVGSSVEVSGILYTPKPALIRIPGHDMEGALVKDVVASVKYDRLVLPPEPVSRTVKKVWDDGDSADRPESVTVQLLKDGEKYDEQVLSAANNWAYTWEELEAAADWSVVEIEVPEGYTVSVSLEDTEFTITNKGDEDVPPPGDSSEPDDSSKPDDSSVPDDSSKPDDTSTSDDNSHTDKPLPPSGTGNGGGTNNNNTPFLPQTGQLWWPVPILLASGCVLLLIGIISWRLSDDNVAD